MKHGFATGGASKIYRRWYAMKERCENRKHKDYKHYGGRGIRVCDRWQSIGNFVKDMGLPMEGMTLERLNNNLGYSKSNCKWVTRSVQSNNKRSTIRIRFRGKMMMAKDIAKITGESSHTIWQRNHRKKLSVL